KRTRCAGMRRAICCLTCQAMASPSRSGSVASSTRSAFLAAAFSSVTTFCLPLMTSYSGSNPCSMSTPILDLGRSMMWPTEAFTVYPDPRYFLIVFAFAGDSTTTSVLRKAFSFAGARALPLPAFACEAAFFAAVVLAVAIRVPGAALDAGAPVWVHGPRRPAKEIFPRALAAKTFQLQLGQPAERLVGGHSRAVREYVDVHRQALVEHRPQLAGRPVERHLDSQWNRCLNGRRDVRSHTDRPRAQPIGKRPGELVEQFARGAKRTRDLRVDQTVRVRGELIGGIARDGEQRAAFFDGVVGGDEG